MPIPDGATEAEYIGGLCNQAVPVVKCETNDLEVPADCEMVFEGYLDRDTLVTEGPFGEMHGYCFHKIITLNRYIVSIIYLTVTKQSCQYQTQGYVPMRLIL